MTNANELLTDLREARRAYGAADSVKVADVLDAADQMASLWDQLDDHMSTGGPPPADWPFPPVPRTKTGRVLSDQDIEALAAEAEEGYAVIILSHAEEALLLANEMNDHPGWSSLAAKIRAARRKYEAAAARPPGRKTPGQVLDRARLADAIQSDGRSWLSSRADAESLADHILTELASPSFRRAT